MDAWNEQDTGDFLTAYIACALWSTTGEDGRESLEDCELAPGTREQMREDCVDFIKAARTLLNLACERPNYCVEDAGHDFWLTRCGHGAGFWDRGLGRLGDDLTALCKAWGNVDLYVGDDGLVYQA